MERSAGDVDRLGCAALSALVPCGDGVWNAGIGTGARVDDVSAAASSELVFSHRNALADRNHPFGKLHVPELSRAGAWDFAARRSVRAALFPAIHEKELPRHERGQTSCATSSRRQVAQEIQRASLRAEARCDGGDAPVDFFCDAPAAGVDGPTP